MPWYDYWCDAGEHELLEQFSMRDAPEVLRCGEHAYDCRRSFRSQRANNNDQFRAYYLSGKAARAAEKQQRAIRYGPRDKHEAKEIERETGRVYIGDDVDRLSEKGQRAVSKTFAHNEKGAP